MRWAVEIIIHHYQSTAPSGRHNGSENFNRAYAATVYRNDHHGDSGAFGWKGLQALPFATPEPELSSIIYDEFDLKIETFSVNHYPITPAVGYLFTYKGRTAYSAIPRK